MMKSNKVIINNELYIDYQVLWKKSHYSYIDAKQMKLYKTNAILKLSLKKFKENSKKKYLLVID